MCAGSREPDVLGGDYERGCSNSSLFPVSDPWEAGYC